MSYQIEPRVLIDGVEVKPEQQDLFNGLPIIIPDTLSFTWGRESIVDQPTPGTASFAVDQLITDDPAQVTLFNFLHIGSVVQIRSSDAVTGRDVLMWSGEITQVQVQRANYQRLTASVSCTDPSTILGNINVGDDPWPEETAYSRLQNILTAASARIDALRPSGSTSSWRWTLTADMDASLRNLQVAFRDVDSQPPLDLIQQLAQTVGGIAWVTADDNGPYIWIEDPSNRQGLRQFVIDSATKQVTIDQIALDFDGVNQWTADDVVPTDVVWLQDPTQAINVVDVNWKQPAGLNDQGNPAYNDAVVEQADPSSNNGIRSFEVGTELVRSSDASQLAYHWLIQVHSGDWLVSGLSIDTDVLNRQMDPTALADRSGQVMNLLDGRTRIGYRLTVTDLPAWGPAGTEQSFYIEGGTYSWVSSRWRLALTATPNAIGGGANFADFTGTGVKFSDFAAGMRFIDIGGVAGPLGFALGFGGGTFGDQAFGA